MIDATLSHRTNFVRSKTFLAWVAIPVAVALAAGLAQTTVGYFLLRTAGLYGEAGSYTSLAFSDPQSLPTRLSSHPARIKIEFTISNASSDPHSYPWFIEIKRTGHTYRLANGKVEVPVGNRAQVTKIVNASCAYGQARMTVQVAAPTESIDFLMACSLHKKEKL